MIVSGLEINSASLQKKKKKNVFNQNDKLPLNKKDTSLHLKGSLRSGRHANKSLSRLISPLTSSAVKSSARVPTVAFDFLHELVTAFFWILTSCHFLRVHSDAAMLTLSLPALSPSLGPCLCSSLPYIAMT